MTTEITRKQAVLLSVLGVVLVVVLFVQLLIRPLMTKVSAAKEQLEVLNQQYSTLLKEYAVTPRNDTRLTKSNICFMF